MGRHDQPPWGGIQSRLPTEPHAPVTDVDGDDPDTVELTALSALDADTVTLPTLVPGDVVELSVPALTSYLGVVRTATAGLAARLSFTLDEIEDLRIAVDEACGMLLSLPRPAGPVEPALSCRFQVDSDTLRVTVSTPVAPASALPAEHSFAWRVLTVHVAEATGQVGDGQATIDLVKRRQRR